MAKSKYLENYKAGQYASTWSALLSKRSQIRNEPLFSEAYAVVRETMTRARDNVIEIVSRLNEIKYEFEYPEEVYLPPAPDVLVQLDEIENLVGILPLSIRLWYEIVGSVNFIGSHPSFSNWEDGDYLRFDPLYVAPLEVTLAQCEIWRNDIRAGYKQAPFEMTIAPDSYHKDDTSGGPAYAIQIPNEDIDAPLLNEWHNTTFVNYFRLSFNWGGFLGFERHKHVPVELNGLISNLRVL